MPAPCPPPPTDRLAAVIACLADCVAEQGNLKRLAAPLLLAIWKRLSNISARFFAVAATKPPPPRRPPLLPAIRGPQPAISARFRTLAEPPPPAMKTPDRSGISENAFLY